MVHVSDCCRYCDDYLDTDEGAEHHDDDGDDVVDSMVRNLSLLFLFQRLKFCRLPALDSPAAVDYDQILFINYSCIINE